MRIRVVFLMAILMLLSVLAGQVMAQTQEYTGYMGDDVADDYYDFDVAEGQTIVITAEATSGTLNSLIGLQDPAGEVIEVNDDRDDTTISSEIVHVASTSGTYQAIMSNVSGTSGEYRMTITVEDAVTMTTTTDSQTATNNQTIGETEIYTGDILSDKDEDRYTINLTAGQGVVITAVATNDSGLDTLLILENNEGVEVAQNDDYEPGTSLNSQIVYVADRTTNYTIVMGNFPGSTGTYELTVEYISGTDANDLLGTEPIAVTGTEADLFYTGYMGDDVPDDLYEITLEAGEGVVITAEATVNSDLDTFLVLDGPDGEEVARNDDSEPGVTLNSQIVYVAEIGGTYTVVMTNFPNSSGDYELSINFVSEANAGELATTGTNQPPEVTTTPDRAPDLSFTGTIVDDDDEDQYPVTLEAGESLIAAVYETDGIMDTLLILRDADGNDIVSNDDRADYQTFNSQFAFTAQEAGEYTVIVTNYPGAPGDYQLELYYATDTEANLAQAAMRIVLTGEMLTYDTPNFRIHYTLEGVDATTFEYVELVGQAVEEVLEIQVNQLGWIAPPPDGVLGGDGRYDVYLTNLDDVYGYVTSSSPIGDNPNTSIVEEFARAAYLVLDNDYANYDDPLRAMRATAAHEFHHIVQYGYDYSDYSWYFEATASWMETITFPEQEEATIYVEEVFNYPEICFGGDGDADVTGSGIYGTWLFLEYMQRNVAEDAPLRMWDNIAIYDGWTALETTLLDYGTNIADTVVGYHLNNLVRDYNFTFAFEDQTVWLEQVIDGAGTWTFTGNGIQELGVNYFEMAAAPGVYDITLNAPDTELEVYAVGIKGTDAAVIPLRTFGTINTSSYDHTYLVVFNRAYDDDVVQCDYLDYSLDVQSSTGVPLQATMGFNATQFTPLELR